MRRVLGRGRREEWGGGGGTRGHPRGRGPSYGEVEGAHLEAVVGGGGVDAAEEVGQEVPRHRVVPQRRVLQRLLEERGGDIDTDTGIACRRNAE